MAKFRIKPLGDRVLVAPLAKEQKSKSGIIIPDTASGERPEQGTVVAVGPGRMTDDGVLLPLAVKKGQQVIFAKYGPDEVKIGDQEYLIIKEESILAVIEE